MDVSLDFREEGGLALELVGEGFDRSEGGRADVMFHALDIVINHLVVETKEIEKIGEELMAVGDIFGEGFSCGGEDETPIFFVIEEAFGVEARVVYGYADLASEPDTPRSLKREPSIVSISRLEAQKRIDTLIDCFDQHIAPHCDWCLDIYGDGSERSQLVAQAERSQYADRIRFHGWASEPASVFEAAGVFVQTSDFEGFGISLVEAMSTGAPCVSFDCPFGPSEIVEHELSGLLVPNGDVGAFGAAVLGLIDNPDRRARIGAAALKRASVFSRQSHNDAWDQIIGTIVRRG